LAYFWDWDVPQPIRYPAEYDDTDRLALSCTQTELSQREQAKLVDQWCRMLPTLTDVRHLFFVSRLPQRLFEAACEIEGLQTLWIKWSGVSRLDALENLRHLRVLRLGSSTRVESIEPLLALERLQVLNLEALTRIDDLAPLGELTGLTALAVQGSIWTDWKVQSLQPLASLRSLGRLSLIGLKPADKSLAPLAGLVQLAELDVPLQYPLSELALLAARLPETKHGIVPHIPFGEYSPCQRCGSHNQVLTSGERRRTLCTSCDADKISKLERTFDELVLSALLTSASS
jgi:hypothetical protein